MTMKLTENRKFTELLILQSIANFAERHGHEVVMSFVHIHVAVCRRRWNLTEITMP